MTLYPLAGFLTETEKHQGHLRECCVGRRQVEFTFGPPQAVLVESGQDVVSAQGFGLGHQLLLCQRSIEHIQDLCSKHRGLPQDLHVLLPGGSGSKSVCDLFGSAVSQHVFIPGGTKFNGGDGTPAVRKENPYLDTAGVNCVVLVGEIILK